MAVTTRGPLAPAALTREEPAAAARENRTPPVKYWALLGAAMVAFIAYVLIDWVSGPFFENVPGGPSDPPTFMQINIVFWQVISIPVALYVIYRFVVRPLRREGTLGVDGLIVIGAALMWFQDPLSSAGNHWITYNAEMVNFGSWVHSVPGFAAFGEPGAMLSEPILFTPFAYVYIMILAAIAGSTVMRKAKERWPSLTTGWLVAICFAAMCLFDIVLEGLIWLPLGVFEYPGGHWAIFPGTYHKYPLNEMITIGAVWTALSSLRYFVNDRGETVVERGITEVRGSNARKNTLRALAVVAFMQVAMFVGYTVPNTFIGLNSTAWPDDLQERSYFTQGICGDGTDRLCPGPGVANQRNGAGYVNAEGGVTVPSADAEPPGVARPGIVPFDIGKPGGDE